MTENDTSASVHAAEWVARAEEDYRAAVALEVGDVPNVICFHCHQCIEKYLKAVLTVLGEAAPRTHDLVLLNENAEAHDAGFAPLYEMLESLNPHAVITRYPGAKDSVEEAQRALEAMQSLRTELRSWIEAQGS